MSDRLLPDDARMDAYYYGFERTGVDLIDAILSAVAIAGKGAHHTQSWNDPNRDYYNGREGLADGDGTAAGLIQANAERASLRVAELVAALAARDATIQRVALAEVSAIEKAILAEPDDTPK